MSKTFVDNKRVTVLFGNSLIFYPVILKRNDISLVVTEKAGDCLPKVDKHCQNTGPEGAIILFCLSGSFVVLAVINLNFLTAHDILHTCRTVVFWGSK